MNTFPGFGTCRFTLRGVFLLAAACVAATALCGADTGADVVVVYNQKLPESKQVAEHYAARRQVPASQVFGFDLPLTETMTRTEFLEKLQAPLLKNLEANKLFTFGSAEKNSTGKSAETGRRVIEAKIRYAALCYGVPTKIARDDKFVELEAEKLRPELRRNEASVDSQLALLPLVEQKITWAGAMKNPVFGVTNAGWIHPTNGVLMVARLDGPSAAIARGLVDKAMDAETNGLWGRAYFDARGVTNSYKLGDDWIRTAANLTWASGFETDLDEKPGTYPASFAMSQIAFYAGWYDENVSGPFTRPQVEFMPGAFAYHLHSFNAETIRSTNTHWVGPLLAKGVTATLGSVYEPYLEGTPEISTFFHRFLFGGFSFGEAAYASQNSLSWQNIAVGDPLYRPFSKRPAVMHAELEKRQSNLVEWSHLRWVDINLAQEGADTNEWIRHLEMLPMTRQSAVLKEKLAELYWEKKKLSAALDAYEQVLKLAPSPQQKIRAMLALAQKRAFYGPDQMAFNVYEQFLKEFPDYPDLLTVNKKLLPLAQKVGKKEDVEQCEKEIKRLSPAVSSAARP